jgi:hypothetical protein
MDMESSKRVAAVLFQIMAIVVMKWTVTRGEFAEIRLAPLAAVAALSAIGWRLGWTARIKRHADRDDVLYGVVLGLSWIASIVAGVMFVVWTTKSCDKIILFAVLVTLTAVSGLWCIRITFWAAPDAAIPAPPATFHERRTKGRLSGRFAAVQPADQTHATVQLFETATGSGRHPVPPASEIEVAQK